MYSVAPMSTPRVGCAAMSTFGLPDNSRAKIAFWILPPDIALSSVFCDGVFTLKSAMSWSQCSSIAAKSRNPRFANGSPRGDLLPG
jgi:hypothetical protein